MENVVNISKYNQEREPAPDISPEELKALHVSRARQILSAAAQEFVDVVILGAFGCGAFRNDPKVVASAYKEVVPEFREHFQMDRFKDSFQRILNDIKPTQYFTYDGMSGNYENELVKS